MNTKVIIVDDFYEDPHSVRDFALSQEFSVTGNFPNARTESFVTDSAKATIQNLVQPHGGEINYWPDGYNGAFPIYHTIRQVLDSCRLRNNLGGSCLFDT